MVTRTIVSVEVVYENGVLRPLEPLPLQPLDCVVIEFEVPKAEWPADTAEIYRQVETEEQAIEPTLTAEEFFPWSNRPEHIGNRYELVKGVPMPCPLETGEAWRPVCRVLQDYVMSRPGASLALPGDGLVVARSPDTVLTPDFMLFLNESPPTDFPKRFTDEIPQLVVELYSASVPYPRMIKRGNDYLRTAGVPLMWMICLEEKIVFVCRLKSSITTLEEPDELTCEDVLPGFRCRVADLFTLPEPAPTPSGVRA